MPFNNIINLIRERISQHMVLLSIAHLGEKIGIHITPYYITQEFLCDEVEINLEPKLKPVSSGFLSPSEIERLYAFPEIKALAEETGDWRDDNCLCFALKYREDIVAYMWCNLRRCNSNFYPFPLKEDEAYLFRARTLNAYRGKISPLFYDISCINV